MYEFKTINALIARMIQQQNSSQARNAFNEGLTTAKIWRAIQSFAVTSLKEDSYQILPREDNILAATPELVACGSDIPVVSGNYVSDPVYYNPFKKRIAIQLCKSKCGPQTFEGKFNEAEKEGGASFGKLLESVFWRGDGVKPGITQTVGSEFSNLSTTNYADLDTQDAIQIANLFSMLSWGMTDPVFYHGPITAELLGWRSQSSTGDTCGDVWTCMVNQLAARFGESDAGLRSRFQSIAQFDHMTGIDSNAPTDPHATIMVIDRAYSRMGISDVEIGSTWNDGADIANSERAMYLTTPQILKMGAVRFAFGFLDHTKIITAEGGRYGDDGIPTVTVPTPLV